MVWLGELLAGLLTKLGASLIAQIMVWIQGKQAQSATNNAIDSKLANLKDAYAKAFDGTTVTPEQKLELKHAIADFIRNPDGTGGL